MKNQETTKTTTNTLTLTALGIVFGDIGTSPLYAVKEAFYGPHAIDLNPSNIMGVLSLIIWSLIGIISIKYLLFVLRADNKGEGGILALTALAVPSRVALKSPFNRTLLYIGLFGSALLFGDGIITPAISVLSAVEGLNVATPLFEPYIVLITIGILTAVFFNQVHGTSKIGAVFGPIILIWYFTLGGLGIYRIIENPYVLSAINPLFAVDYFLINGWHGFVVLGAVFLVVTGGEAPYADMGHIGKNPIQRAWFFVAFPGLILNYFGQGSLLLKHPELASNPFYNMAPSWGLYPLVVISTLATVIASQALITGVYSLTHQAVQLGYLPRFKIKHTSSEEIGQIYIPHINWILFILTCWCVLTFKSSSALAAAYGIAVSLTMVITSLLACSVAYYRWKWNGFFVSLILALLLISEGGFLVANTAKIADGGWFPLLIGSFLFLMMITWSNGRRILIEKLKEKSLPLNQFLDQIKTQDLAKIKGTAIFMTGSTEGSPLPLVYNTKHNKCLHERNILLTVLSTEEARVEPADRIEVLKIQDGFYRVFAKYGFMERAEITNILNACKSKGLDFKNEETTFFLGRELILSSSTTGWKMWRDHLFSFMSKNSERATAYFDIPLDQVIEFGVQIKLS